MAKVDVKSAYRNVPIHPHDRWLMGMLWKGSLYIDTALPFGLRSASKIFTAVANAVEWIVSQEGVDFTIHYLDDYLVVGAPASPECAKALACASQHPWTNWREGAWSRLNFLGFELVSSTLQIRLPQAKLRVLQQLISTWVGRKSCSQRELESVVGQLGHATWVAALGKMFIMCRQMPPAISVVGQCT